MKFVKKKKKKEGGGGTGSWATWDISKEKMGNHTKENNLLNKIKGLVRCQTVKRVEDAFSVIDFSHCNLTGFIVFFIPLQISIISYKEGFKITRRKYKIKTSHWSFCF